MEDWFAGILACQARFLQFHSRLRDLLGDSIDVDSEATALALIDVGEEAIQLAEEALVLLENMPEGIDPAVVQRVKVLNKQTLAMKEALGNAISVTLLAMLDGEIPPGS